MDKQTYNLTKEEVLQYGGKNGYAQMMFCDSGDDYISARCLILNGLITTGSILFSQSVEKMLKAFIFLTTGKPTKLKLKDKHNPYLLKEELKKEKNYGLDKYDELLKKSTNTISIDILTIKARASP